MVYRHGICPSYKLIIISDRYGEYTVKVDNKDFLNYLLNISYSFNILTSF